MQALEVVILILR